MALFSGSAIRHGSAAAGSGRAGAMAFVPAPALAWPALPGLVPFTAIGIPAAALAATALPLLTYTLGLALFGLAHVVSELRYVDRRFGSRLGRRLRWTLGSLLAVVVGLRLCGLAGWLPPAWTIPAELMVVALLAATALPQPGARPFAAVTAAGLAMAASLWPFQTLAILAVAHNLTPLGFLAEGLRGRERRRALAWGAALFIGVPAVIASGGLQVWLGRAGLLAPDATLLDAGPLVAHLGVYLPRALHDAAWAEYAFSAAVFAQLMHYAAVIYLLPRLLPAGTDAAEPPLVPWPRPAMFGAVLAGVAAVAALGFAADFVEARAVYALAAAVHAWIEIPLLLLALPAALSVRVTPP